MKPLDICVGNRFGDFSVISDVYKNKKDYRCVRCQCKCGKILEKYCSNLKRLTKCKTCMGKELQKFKAGDKFHKLTILEYDDSVKKRAKILVACDCGEEFKTSSYLISKTKECRKCYNKRRGVEHQSYIGTKNVSGTYYSQVRLGAAQRNILFDVSIEFIDELLVKQQYKCALSGIHIVTSVSHPVATASLDRIDSKGGYTPENVQWVHKNINKMKTDLDEFTFITLCEAVARCQLRV